MYNQKHFNPVNWKDGMKMNKSHFMATDNAYIDGVRDAIQTKLSPVQYGLVCNDANESINMQITIDNQNLIKAKLLLCDAVTLGGARIYIHKENLEQSFTQLEATQATKAGEEGIFRVTVSVNYLKEPHRARLTLSRIHQGTHIPKLHIICILHHIPKLSNCSTTPIILLWEKYI